MRLHYNAACTHNDTTAAQLRLLYWCGRYTEALDEVVRLNELPLSDRDRLVVNANEVAVRLANRSVSYTQARTRLAELAARVQETSDENYIAEFRARRIALAARYSDHELAIDLTNHFFDDIARTPITEAHWRIGQGAAAQHVRGPAAAIPFYLTVVMQLEHANRPCLREMAARHMAFCLKSLGDPGGALTVLRDIGLRTEIAPEQGEIPLSDLLLLPLR